MANVRTYARSFAGGEVTPEFFGRIDDAKYQSGLGTCRNFIVLPHGPVQNRPGTQFVREVKNSAKRTRLLPFSFSTTQTMAVELGAGYFRFHSFGQTLQVPTGIAAWNSGTTYVLGDLVTYSGGTYYAVTTVPVGTNPTSTYVPVPTPAASWVDTTGLVDAPPAGYTNVGDTLPTIATAGSLVYVQIYTQEFNPLYGGFDIGGMGADQIDNVEPYITVIKYRGYTGTANTPGPTAYWYQMSTTNYEIPNSYAETDLADIHFVQSADVMTLVHPNYPPAELRRLGATKWTLVNIAFGTPQVAPTSVVATAHRGSPASSATKDYTYVVTTVAADGSTESLPSAVATCHNNLLDSGALNTITWTGSGTRYNVYRLAGGLQGFMGIATTGLFEDDGSIIPDASKTPPISNIPFNASGGNYPGAVSYHEQRRVFAGTVNKPQNVWATRSGTETDLSYSIPVRDDDGLQFKVAAREANTIRHIVPLSSMVLLTSAAEFAVAAASGGALTSSDITVSPQSYIGSNNAQPAVVNNSVLYAAARGGHIRELTFDWRASAYTTGDISLRAPHLFDNFAVTEIAYAKSPIPILWFVSTSGRLLGLTYVPDQQVTAWHQHDTDGVFESICVIAEGAEDRLYAIIRRVINGISVRYVERLGTRQYVNPQDAFFVDCGATYTGDPVASISSGLAHLEGKVVNILADGAVHPQRTVTSGVIMLDQAASTIQVGLPINADMVTLPIGLVDIPGAGQGRPKNVNKVFLRVNASSGVFAGPDSAHLTQYKQRTTEVYGSPPNLTTGEIEIVIDGYWGDGGQVFVRQADPLPLTVLSLTPEISIGG